MQEQQCIHKQSGQTRQVARKLIIDAYTDFTLKLIVGPKSFCGGCISKIVPLRYERVPLVCFFDISMLER